MPHVYADRVKELTASTGPGALLLAGAAEGGFATFATGIGVGNTTDICIRDPATGEWEVTLATLTAATTLTRGALKASSTGGRISFASGTKEVFCCLPAVEAMRRTDIEAALAALTAGLATKAPLATPIVTASGSTLTPTAAQAGCYFRCTNAAGCAVTIPANASEAFAVGSSLTFSQSAAGALTFTGAVGVTIHVAATHLAQTVDQYAVVQLVQVAADTWAVFGNLEAA